MDKQSGTSALKLILIIALGIILASFIGCVASIAFTGAVLKGASDVIQKNQPIQNRNLAYTAPRLIPNVSKNATEVIEEMGKGFQENAMRAQQKAKEKAGTGISEESKIKYTQVKREMDIFKKQYKKPAECYDMKDNATRINCANMYMRAKADFDSKLGIGNTD